MKRELNTPQAEMCEQILREELAYNRERDILRSENEVICRLLTRSQELRKAFSEVVTRLKGNKRSVEAFIRSLLCTAAQWCPEKNAEARGERKRLQAVNAEIASTASRLADLLEERSDLHNDSGFSSSDIYDLHSATVAAAKGHYLFESYPRTEFHRLFAQYDGKYWPDLSEVVRALGEDAGAAEIYATDPLTEAGTRGNRNSRADFFRAWFASIEENGSRFFGFLPDGFRLSDESMATLGDCALGGDPDNPLGADYVKRLRQRAREAGKGIEGERD